MPFDPLPVHDLATPQGRSRHIADAMERLPEHAVWMSGYTKVEAENECGTAGCIIGWACELPALAPYVPDGGRGAANQLHADKKATERFFGLPYYGGRYNVSSLIDGGAYLRKRWDGEPYKADVVARLRQGADWVETRQLAAAAGTPP